ncbi:hypothetical protein F4780DRAFT_13115 [Xylariomycetidae sp. FL0641]|nr:hypothetical protein F4780DRAFT_13115 [Xylariomycetidae sp. FL0641]
MGGRQDDDEEAEDGFEGQRRRRRPSRHEIAAFMMMNDNEKGPGNFLLLFYCCCCCCCSTASCHIFASVVVGTTTTRISIGQLGCHCMEVTCRCIWQLFPLAWSIFTQAGVSEVGFPLPACLSRHGDANTPLFFTLWSRFDNHESTLPVIHVLAAYRTRPFRAACFWTDRGSIDHECYDNGMA